MNLVETHRDDGVTTVFLNRPERHNALVPELLSDLLGALGQASRAPKPLVLAAHGRSFSTGGDLDGFLHHEAHLAEYAQHLVGELNTAILALLDHPCPVFCAVQGPVCGGALGLLLASDGVVFHPSATVQAWYPAVGFSPDGGWTALLPRRIGEGRVRRVLATNHCITASEAEAWGLADAIDDAPLERARDMARTASQFSVGSMASARRLLCERDRVKADLEAERAAFVQQITRPDALNGMKSFLEKSS